MSNEDRRVLGRRGAHELTKEQILEVSGGLVTPLSRILTSPLSNPDSLRDT
jgi:hypothetical protein